MTRCQKSPRIAVLAAVIVMLMSAAHQRDIQTVAPAPDAKAANHFEFDLSLPGIRAHLVTSAIR
ncbi:hypothetical protein KY084_12685 [Stakelama sp. CBK3Z-3]|uniref:Uncharacterized protein n=1 Tax=Stakelama flava TaxID=2860338 RepID=A0ABS6XNF2_9SPHN|nr:hypothetical protein [Stakelama flava]MBW4331727.1 hypothetical protein [Stakelama flava]